MGQHNIGLLCKKQTGNACKRQGHGNARAGMHNYSKNLLKKVKLSKTLPHLCTLKRAFLLYPGPKEKN
jgi:hypothetical protein